MGRAEGLVVSDALKPLNLNLFGAALLDALLRWVAQLRSYVIFGQYGNLTELSE